MFIFLIVLLILAILAEGMLTTLPLTLVCLICLTIYRRDTSLFSLAFIAGLFIDVLRVQPIGGTSALFICFLFLILLYKKKYEIYSFPFVMLSTFFGAFIYLHIFQNEGSFIQALVCAGIAVVLFAVINFKLKVQDANLQF